MTRENLLDWTRENYAKICKDKDFIQARRDCCYRCSGKYLTSAILFFALAAFFYFYSDSPRFSTVPLVVYLFLAITLYKVARSTYNFLCYLLGKFKTSRGVDRLPTIVLEAVYYRYH